MAPADRLQPTADGSFYVTSGTLRHDAPSYVERQADHDLFEGLKRGEFCYVLTSRQMGKSSLMARTAARLRQENIAVAVLDLTRIGQNLTVEQWYDGMLGQLGRQLSLEEELEEYWEQHERHSPLQRWLGALEQIVLPALGVRPWALGLGETDGTTAPSVPNAQRLRPNAQGPLVIFIDEIDMVRSLPFPTDEFFAAIRQCYNRRTEEPEFQYLTFCLLGVATPSDLIQDPHTTPFNVGRRIELTDFTPAEAAPLARGLAREGEKRRRGEGGSKGLLKRILYWTGGHPYLTQRLCQAIAAARSLSPSPPLPFSPSAAVDRHCEALFFSPRARERDNNLLFVREGLLRAEADRGRLLQLYAEVHSPRGRVPDSEMNRLATLLHLSGVVREQEGCLRVRNRIYARVFDRAWITANMPDVEARRLRALARQEARRRRLAEERERALRRSLYVSDMNLAQQAWDAGNVGRALELLEAHRPGPGEEDLRGFEWRLFWRLCQHGDALFTWTGHPAAFRSVAYSPDGQTLAAGSEDGTAKLWALATKQEIASLKDHPARLSFVGFPPDGGHLISASVDGTVQRWNVASRRKVTTLQGEGASYWFRRAALSPSGMLLAIGNAQGTVQLFDLFQERLIASLTGHTRPVLAAAFSPNGKTLATGSLDASVRLWDVAAQHGMVSFEGFHEGVYSVAFAPDGQILATGSWDGIVRLWDIATRRLINTLKGHKGLVASVAFSPDGQLLASTGDSARLWDLATQRLARTLNGHQGPILAVAFSPDGSTLATGGQDQTVRLWAATAETKAGTLHGHGDQVWCLAFSPDGQMLATGSYDSTVCLWDVATEQAISILHGHEQPVVCVAFSPDGKILASGTGAWTRAERPGEVRLWDVIGRQELMRFPEQKTAVQSLAFSPDGGLLATRGSDGAVKLWDVATRQEVVTLEDDRPTGVTWGAAVLFSPDGQTLASARTDGGNWPDDRIRLWDLRKPWQLAHLVGQTGGMTSGAFSADGKMLIAGSENGIIVLWDVAAKRRIADLKEVAGAVYSVALSPDGKTLAAGYLDANVRLWDMGSLRQVATLSGHENSVTAVAFSPDGNILASASADATVRLWRAAPCTETNG